MPDMLTKYQNELREYTACGDASLSDVQLERDIAGYTPVKEKIKKNILNLLVRTTKMNDEDEIRKIEAIIPRGLIFFGPPGTGKTLFAKGIAEALNAAFYIVSGPELKSKWVGEGEANIRRLFAKARATSPSVIVFDEFDSIAGARTGGGGDGASQASHSMVNQLLTEMDGFRKDQLVLVVGTTNFVESLDPAFLRPGRFEFQIEIPYPEPEDRKGILTLYNKKFNTGLSEEHLEKLAMWTARPTNLGTPYTGDHLSAMIKDFKRFQINSEEEQDIDKLLNNWLKSKENDAVLTPEEEKVVSCHEAGHALMFFHYKRQDEITKITLESGGTNALGYVESKSAKPDNFYTEGRLRSEIGIALGGYIAERLVFGEVSTGACGDLRKSTAIATDMIAMYGMGGIPRDYTGRTSAPDPYFLAQLSPRIDKLLELVYKDAEGFIVKNKDALVRLYEKLIESRTLGKDDVIQIVGDQLKDG
jgi:cell division protease FtsH